MDESEYLDYEEDMDRMLDDELQIMREVEEEFDKENAPASRRSLDFGKENSTISPPPSLTNIKPHETNVFVGKRARSSETSEPESGAHEANLNDTDDVLFPGTKSPRGLLTDRANAAKRARVDGGGDVLSDIGNVSLMSQPLSQPAYRVPRMGERKVYRRVPLDSDFVSVTLESGDRFYLRMKPQESEVSAPSHVSEFKDSVKSRKPTGLCGVPFSKLLEDAEEEIEKLRRRDLDPIAVDSGIESSEDDEPGSSQELWVEKFKPRSYLDLLSDVGTNRTLLKWLKLWDRLVFGKEHKKVHRPKPEEPGRFQQILPEVIEELDDLHRPKQRVALLHGPPGLGKTTLAHIVARHAGYNIVEMNASDDRSVDAFKKKLEASTQMRSVLTEDQRPNCLIIDEIDGAPAPTINYLVSVLSGKQAASGKKKDKKSSQILRPVICICNELYTPSLRPLRQLALVIPFPPTSASKLAERLKEIAIKEKLCTDLTALLALCKKSDNDIRSCLSTLQFFNRKGKVLRAQDVASVSLGTKDTQKSLFSVWSDIFNLPSSDASHRSKSGQARDDPAVRMKHIQIAVARSGETDRIMTGVFENYLAIPFKNMCLKSVVDGLEWFCHYDMVHQEMLHSQNYSIMGHLTFPLVKAHFLFSVPGRVRIMFPTQATELRNRINNVNNIIESVTNEMLPSTRAFCSKSVLVRELLPYLLSLVQPVLRPINTQLYSVKEKSDLRNLINIHIAYNISYNQERNAEGQYDYRMDPDVESVVAFPGVKRTVQLTYGSKQLISHEIELEKMRRIDVVENETTSTAETTTDTAGTPSKPKPGLPASQPSSSSATPKGSKTTTSHLQKLTPKQVVIREKQATDFFGRVIKKTEKPKTAEESKNEIVKTDVWFKFKEGYSNAVRRNVKIKDFV